MSFLPNSIRAAAAAAALLSLGAAARAQVPADQLKIAYEAGRNQLGLMAYCQDKGHVGADVVDIQKKLIGMMPPPADKSGGDAAEAQGRKGIFAAMGMQQDIETVAKAQNGSPASFCKQIGEAIRQVGAALPK
jgi:hypothetical protein